MKSPSYPEPYLQRSISSGGAPPSAKALYQQRKNYGKYVSTKGDVSEYKVEHLATFSLERKEAVQIINESIHKLKLLDARGKVWSQEIFLNIDDKSIKLIDCDSREELENFSLLSLLHIQSVIDACNYNNICALLIKDAELQTVDVHLFQCSVVPADVICADIDSALQDLKSKKGRKSRLDSARRQEEAIKAASPPKSSVPLKNGAAKLTGNQVAATNIQENTPEILALKIQRDVEILNHALDDIEMFVLLLQRSADANKELTLRQSKRKSSKRNKAPGNGIMELRARLPPKEKFVDCLQKFRLCFTLLAKLKAQIKDPSSVELLHFVFSPLGLIIHTCCGPDLARHVRRPPFNQTTIKFIRTSATPKEIRLWESLGEFWTKSRDEFPEDMPFPPYEPTFSSGWVPPPLPSNDSEDQEFAASVLATAVLVEQAKDAQDEDDLKPPSPPPVVTSAPVRQQSVKSRQGSSKSLNQYESNGVTNGAPVAPAATPPAQKLCRAMYDFNARNDRELTVKLHDIMDVLDDAKSWWKVQNKYGETGFVPGNLMMLISPGSRLSASSSTESPPTVIPPPPLVPQPKAKPKVPRAPSPPPMVVLPTRNPSPPPPPPVKAEADPAPTESASVKMRSMAFSRAKENTANVKKSSTGISEGLHEELRQRVESQKKRNFILPRKSSSSSDVAINKSSSRAQVKFWLQCHGFSATTVASLSSLNGAQLFSLKKEELKQISEEEGSRVHSKLLIQKSSDGFHTTTGNSELAKIMLKRRQEVEVEEAE